MQRFDIEQQSSPSQTPVEHERRSQTAITKFAPTTFYYFCLLITSVSVTYTIVIVKPSHIAERDSCFSSTIVPTHLHALVLPTFHILYSLALRNIPTKISHVCFGIFGLSCSIIYISFSVWTTVRIWSCSNFKEKIDIMCWIFASFLWFMTWLHFTLVCFYVTYLKDNPLQLLLFIRCYCISPRLKKVIVIFPYFALSISLFIEAYRLR